MFTVDRYFCIVSCYVKQFALKIMDLIKEVVSDEINLVIRSQCLFNI